MADIDGAATRGDGTVYPNYNDHEGKTRSMLRY